MPVPQLSVPAVVMGVCGEEYHFAPIGIEDHLLEGAPMNDGGNRTL